MSLFDEYYDEYNTYVKMTADCTAQLLSADVKDTAAHKEPCQQIEEALGAALDVIKQMEIHGRSLRKPKNKEVILERCKTFRKTVTALRTEYESAKEQIERQLLFDRDVEAQGGGGGGAHQELDQDSRDRLVATTDTLHGTSDTIKRSLSALDETTSVGADIAAELQRSREKIESAAARVGGVSMMGDQARRSVHSMAKRENRQRAIIVAAVVGLLVTGGLAASWSTW